MIAQLLKKLVRDRGYIGAIEGDFVEFKVEGNAFQFQTFDPDETYSRLMLKYAMPSDVTMERLLTAANEQNQTSKAVKTGVYPTVDDGVVAFSVELFLGDASGWEPIFERALQALRTASDQYYGRLANLDLE